MLRRAVLAVGTAVVALSLTAQARAQYFGYGAYPNGYSGWGWGGWTAALPDQGDVARGLGYYAESVGEANLENAKAQAINAQTVAAWNEYLYRSQVEANRRARIHMNQRFKRDAQAGDLIHQRMLKNPTAEDIAEGGALNAILDQFADPRVHSSALRRATTTIPGKVVRSIPFTNASEAITLSLNHLTAKDGWPTALQGEHFGPERLAYQEAVAQALKEDEDGAISPATIRAVQDAALRLRAKLAANPPASKVEYAEAQGYVRTLIGMSRMLEKPRVEKILAELDTIKKTTLGSLLGFMHTFNLRFGRAETPEQRAAYTQLYPLLAAERDKILKDAGIADDTPPKPERERPPDFFQGIHMDHLEGKSKPKTP